MASFLDYEHGISVIDAHHHRPKLAAFYLIIEGNQAAFIDTGTSHSIPDALDVLARKGLTPKQVAYVIPTHVHLDHAGGAGAMMRRFPNAKLVAHPKGARHLIDPTKLIAGVTAVYSAKVVARDFGEIVPVDAARVMEAPDGFTLDLNGRQLLFLDTPGHARHHFCVVDGHSRGFLPAIPLDCLTVSWIRTTANSFFPPPRRCSSSPRHCTHPSTVSWTCTRRCFISRTSGASPASSAQRGRCTT